MNNDKKIKAVSEQTGISVKELNRLNHDLWYHGTTIEDAENIQKNGVLADYNLGDALDFGPGFYLTDTYQRAMSFISRKPSITSTGELQHFQDMAIITFSFNPFDLIFQTDAHYSFHNFSKHSEDFANFVFFNRLYNTENENPHNFDIIWGVMSDNNPFKIIMDYKSNLLTKTDAITLLQKSNSMRQLYIANQDICNMLRIKEITRGGLLQ